MARWLSYCGWLILIGIAGTLLVMAGRYLAMDQLDEQIRAQIEAKLAAHYKHLVVQVGGARRIAGRGIEIRAVTISLPRPDGSQLDLVAVDEVLVRCSTELPQLLSGRLNISHLTLRHVRLAARRELNGVWTTEHLWPLPQLSRHRPYIAVENSSVQITDAMQPDRAPCILRDINATLGCSEHHAASGGKPSATEELVLCGVLTGNHFERAQFSARIDPDSGTWQGRGSVAGLEISRRLLEALPAKVAEHLSPLARLQARAHLDLEVASQPQVPGSPLPFYYEISGRLEEGRVSSEELPFPLSDLQARLYCDNHGIRIDHLRARSGRTQLQGALQCGFDAQSPLHLRLDATQLRLEERLIELYSDKLRQVWDKLSPEGVVDVHLVLTSDAQGVRPEVRLRCHGVQFMYDRFPYRLDDAVGVVHLRGDTLTIEPGFTARAADQVVHIAGTLSSIETAPTGWVEVSVEGPVPLDHHLIGALDLKSRQVVNSLQPTGEIVVQRARLERSDPEQPFDKQLDVLLKDCTVQYEKFPYLLSGVHGRLLLKDARWQFLQLEGYNDSAFVVGEGTWTPAARQGGLLELKFVAHDVPLEDELRAALNDDFSRFWTGLRPRGSIDRLAILMRYDTSQEKPQLSLDVEAQKWPPQQNVEGRSISIEPVWFPYRLDELTGTAVLRDGVVQLHGVRALHGKTEIQLEGAALTSHGGHWTLALSQLAANRLELDRSLLAALPEGLERALAKLQLQGPVNLQTLPAAPGERPLVALQLDGAAGKPLRAQWNLSVDVYDGQLSFGVPLKHIHGAVHLRGESDERGFRSTGQLEIDSLHVRQAQLTQLKGPLWIDSSRIALGTWTSDQLGGSQPPISAELFGGTFKADVLVSLEEDRRFDVRASLSGGDLARISRTTTGRSPKLSGVATANVRMFGSANRIATTLGGGGRIQLRDADIYKLPVMVRLLAILSVRQPDNTAFTTSDIQFRFEGDQLLVDRIDFNGDAISLKGRGTMDFRGQMDLSFYTLVGRQELQLPLPRALLGEASRQILEIQVTGTLEEPTIQPKSFPGWNETLQQLFPELAGEPPQRRALLPAGWRPWR